MSNKTAISIGKDLGNLIQVEDSCGDRKPFRSFLRLLVELDVHIPLKPGFIFRREGGDSLDILLKCERLDIYCCSCGRIGTNPSIVMLLLQKRSLRNMLFLCMLIFSLIFCPPLPQEPLQPSPILNSILLFLRLGLPDLQT
jgi:hypothetical protein